MPQLLHYLKVDRSTQINKFKCINKNSEESATSNAPCDDKDVFVNKTNEVS
jgi:hypothetical protein